MVLGRKKLKEKFKHGVRSRMIGQRLSHSRMLFSTRRNSWKKNLEMETKNAL